jgi:hypothetical protein
MVIEGCRVSSPRDGLPLTSTQTRWFENVVLCLFDSAFDHVKTHLKPESIYFRITMNPSRKFSKFLRSPVDAETDIPFKDTGSLVVDISMLAKETSKISKSRKKDHYCCHYLLKLLVIKWLKVLKL